MENRNDFDMADFKKAAEGAKKSVKFLLLIPIFIFIYSGVYQISPDEVGVVKRFGEYKNTVHPGLHFKIPMGVDIVQKVTVKRQLKEEFGFRTISAGVKSTYTTQGYIQESQMLTGDLSIGDIEWIVQYKIQDPVKFLFKVRDRKETFRNICEAVMREIIGNRSINEVLTIGREEISIKVKDKIQQLCDQYETGIDVKLLVLQDVNPPDAVKPSFNEVNQAQQEKENMINQAWAQYNKVIPNARGEALQVKEEADGYALKRVNEAKGDVARFVAIYQEYRKAPIVTKKRLYFETMEKVVPKFGRTIIIDESQKSLLPLLNLDKEVIK